MNKRMMDKIVANICTAYHEENMLKCRTLLENFCADIPASDWRGYMFTGFDAAMPTFAALHETGLYESPKGSSLRILSLRVTEYVHRHAPPEIKEVFSSGLTEILPELQSGPAHYDDGGQQVFSVDQIARALETDVDTVTDLAEEAKDAGVAEFVNEPAGKNRLQ